MRVSEIDAGPTPTEKFFIKKRTELKFLKQEYKSTEWGTIPDSFYEKVHILRSWEEDICPPVRKHSIMRFNYFYKNIDTRVDPCGYPSRGEFINPHAPYFMLIRKVYDN